MICGYSYLHHDYGHLYCSDSGHHAGDGVHIGTSPVDGLMYRWKHGEDDSFRQYFPVTASINSINPVFQSEWRVVSEGASVKELAAARATVDRAVRFFSGMSLDRCSTEDQCGFLIHLRALMDIAQPGNANAEMIAKGKK